MAAILPDSYIIAKLFPSICQQNFALSSLETVTVTEALVLHPLYTRRPKAHHRVNPYLGARRQNEIEIISDYDETSPSIAAVLPPSVACSMLAVQQQKRLCRQFVDVSAARRSKKSVSTLLNI